MKPVFLFAIAVLPLGCGSPRTAAKRAPMITPGSTAPSNAAAPKLVWEQFMPSSGAFDVELPGPVQEQQTTQSSSSGEALVLQYLVDLSGSVFGVQLTAYPPGVLTEMFPQQVVSAARDAFLSGMDAEVIEQEKNTYVDPNDDTRTFPGRLVVAETPDGLLVKCQWYVVGDAVYQLMQTSPKELPFTGAFERMVRSFRLSSQ